MDDFPTEILDLILDFVEINRPRFHHGLQYEAFYREFHSLSLTSKTLHRLSQPRLYRHFLSLHRGRGIVRLARTLCEKPKLADYLEIIDVAPSTSIPSVVAIGPGSQTQASEAEWYAALKIMRTLGKRAAISDGLYYLCSTAWMLILLSTAYNVESITIRHTDEPAHQKQTACKHCPAVPDHLPLIFAPARLQLLPAGAYNRLYHISIEGYKHPGETKTYASVLSSILRLPALETLECINFAARQELPENWSRVHRTSALKTVEFRNGNLDALSILDVLDSCTNLEALTIVWKKMDSPMHGEGGAWCRVDIWELMHGLETHQHTLRSLTLTNIPNSSLIFYDQPAAGSLRHFEKLEELAIDELLLVFNSHWSNLKVFWEEVDLDQIFPSTLRALTIHSFNFLRDSFLDMLRGMSTYHGEFLRFFSITSLVPPPYRYGPLAPLRDELTQKISSFVALEERQIFDTPRIYLEYRWADAEECDLEKCLSLFTDPQDFASFVDSEESGDI